MKRGRGEVHLRPFQGDKLGRPEVLRYDAVADRRSWNQMRALLDEVFG